MSTAGRHEDLIGRLDERAALERWLAESLAGAPRIVIVSGLPGMGKTRLLRALTARAQARGCLVGWGSALENIDVPFLAAAPLLAALPGGADALQVGDDSPLPWGSTASQQLVQAVRAVHAAAIEGPVMLVVDDVQWGDEATLAFVQHLAVVMDTSTVRLPLLLAVTLRTGDGDEPGRRVVGRLAREPAARQLHVGPLDEVEVREVHRSLTDRYPSAAELRSLMDATGGSPLLVRAQVASGGPGRSGHEGVDLLGSRYAGLPRPTRRAVEMLALLGERVATAALAPLLGDTCEQLLAPAVDAEMLAIDGSVVSFEHSLYRNAVVHSIDASRFESVAHDVAVRVCSEPLRSLLPPAMVVAHLRRAPDAVPPDVAADIGWAAGTDAYNAGAWGRAAAHFEAALLAAESAGRWPEDRAERWFLAGEAAFRDHDVECAARLSRALDIATEVSDVDVIARSTILRARALLTLGAGTVDPDDEAQLVALAGQEDPGLDRWRSALLGIAAECRMARFDVEGGADLARRARRAAELSADPLSTWAVEIGEGLQHLAGLELTAAAECFARGVDSSERAGSPWHEASSRHRVALVELLMGRLGAFDESVAHAMAVSRSCHHWAECSFGGGLRTFSLAVRGSPDYEAEAENAAAMYRRTSYNFTPALLFPPLAYARAIHGDLLGAAGALSELDAVGQTGSAHRRALARIERMLHAAPAPELPATWRTEPAHLGTLAWLGAVADDAVETGDAKAMADAARSIDEVMAAGVVMAPNWPHFFPRIRAAIAVALGEPDARDRVATATAGAASLGLSFECVLLDLLAGAVADDERVAAERTTDALRRADAAGLLAGVALAQERLRRLGVDPLNPMVRAVLNTDIVSSTDLTRTLGDERWLRVLDEHDEVVKTAVRRHGGVIFKHTGDGVFAWFASAADAVTATEHLLGVFEQGRLDDGRVAFRIRAGLALGSPRSRSDGDLFGMTVIEAARLCALAAPGTGLASGAVAESAAHPLRFHGRLDLKGFDEQLDAFSVVPAG